MGARTVIANHSAEHLGKLHKALIDNVIKLLPDDSDLQVFSKHFLESISFRILKTYRNSVLVDFIKKRYEFYKQSLKGEGDFVVYRSDYEEKTILEIVCPYAPHIFVTIEGILNNFGINIKFRAHPLIPHGLSKEIDNIDDKDKIVVIYFELEEIKDNHLIDELKDKIKDHLLATSLSYVDQDKISNHVDDIIKQFSKLGISKKKVLKEQVCLIEWLRSNWFQFGYCSFDHNLDAEESAISVNSNGIGILRSTFLNDTSSSLRDIVETYIWHEKDHSVNHFSFGVIKCSSPVLRFNNLMCLKIGIPKSNNVVEEHIFVGHIKGSALHSKNLDVPIIRKKMKSIFKSKDMVDGGYNYNQVIRICNTLPKFELFRISVDSLQKLIENLLAISNPNEVYCFYRNVINQVLEVTVVVPLIYDQENLRQVIKLLHNIVPHSDSEVLTINGQENNWIQFYFDLLGDKKFHLDSEKIELKIKEATKNWENKVLEAMQMHHSPIISKQLCQMYLPLMPNHYKASTSEKETVEDILYLEQLAHSGDVQFNLTMFTVPQSNLKNLASLLYIYSREKIDLNGVMPILQNFGFYILDQINSRIGDSEKTQGYIQSYRVQNHNRKPVDLKKHRKKLIKFLEAVFQNKTENDQLNALMLRTDLNWRDINVMQLYRNYYLQLGVAYTQERINNTMLKYPEYITAIFHYFMTKFSPENKFGNVEYRTTQLLPVLKKKFIESLRNVSDIADDVILRTLFKLVQATIRTNYFVPKENGETYISVKIDPSKIEQMPTPKPYREIYIHDVGFEATHLRFGPVARGGLRWSDRREDFRTEILGLVKTQQSKNVVIVPVGSKGGFVLKKHDLPRAELIAESKKQYKKFISGMLDITDNLDQEGEAYYPNYVMPYDQLDPYLVVAADKGTATYSDDANAVSKRHGFWLGDGFASGGSVGYDHKKEGITARGAWECVKLHFREMGKDVQTQSTKVIGVGDMSGDVFGNGMLLSKTISLQAAFNHVHIFIDPTPNELESWTERQRLFQLARSTWKDFQLSIISQGGGVFERSAKEIPLTSEIQELLKCSESVLNGEQLIKKILKMKTELIWLGGIGTYMKSDDETHFQVGDQANNAVRIDISECQAKVIGEGANLGVTQKGRLLFDQLGGRLNSDAIDNSAGVNMSDYEVNIKILLQQLLQNDFIKNQIERQRILAKATDEVSDLVLINNRDQHRLISMDCIRSGRDFKIFKFLIHELITTKGLDHHGESIPSRGELERMDKAKECLQRPVLAKLQAYVKMYVYDEFLLGKLIDSDFLIDFYKDYFPKSIRDKFSGQLLNHQLKREIVATQLTNYIINRAGITFFHHIEKSSGHHLSETSKLYLIFDQVLDGQNFKNEILEIEGVSEKNKYKVLLEFENLIQYCCLRSLQVCEIEIKFSIIEVYKNILKKCQEHIHINDKSLLKEWDKKGFDYEWANKIAKFKRLRILPNVIYFHDKYKIDAIVAMNIINDVNSIFGIEWLNESIKNIDIATDWELGHKEILLKDLESHKMSLVRYVIEKNKKSKLSEVTEKDILKTMNLQYGIPVSSYLQTLNVLRNGAILNLTSLSVGVSKLNIL